MVVASASMSCYLFVTYQLLAHRALRQALHNHAILVNLCFNTIVVMIDLPFILSYLYLEHVLPVTAGYCLIWQFIDYGIWFTDIFVTFWASIERHILIFHSNWLNTAKNRFLIHWLPLPTEKFSTKNRGLPRCLPPRYRPVYLHRKSQTLNEVFWNRLKPRHGKPRVVPVSKNLI